MSQVWKHKKGFRRNTEVKGEKSTKFADLLPVDGEIGKDLGVCEIGVCFQPTLPYFAGDS